MNIKLSGNSVAGAETGEILDAKRRITELSKRIYILRDDINRLLETTKNGSLTEERLNRFLIDIAQKALGGIVEIKPSIVVFDAKPKEKITITDRHDIARTGIYEVLEIVDNVLEVRRLNAEYPYRAKYSLYSLGKSWSYENIAKRKAVVSWDRLLHMKGQTIIMSPAAAEKPFPFMITGFDTKDGEGILIGIREGKKKESIYRSRSKGKSWEAYLEYEAE